MAVPNTWKSGGSRENIHAITKKYIPVTITEIDNVNHEDIIKSDTFTNMVEIGSVVGSQCTVTNIPGIPCTPSQIPLICGENKTCVNEVKEGDSCSVDNDCFASWPPPMKCKDNKCSRFCNTDSDCALLYNGVQLLKTKCNNNKCTPSKDSLTSGSCIIS